MNSTLTPVSTIESYINPDGKLVFTENYHLRRGYCCKSGCLHCPYHYKENIDPNIPSELQSNWSDDENIIDENEDD